MLTTRSTKRTGREHFAWDFRVDILEGETELGQLTIDRKTGGGALTLEGANYAFTHARGIGLGETPLEIIVRWILKKPKPPPDHYELRDATGRVLATADQMREVFAITCEAGRFRFAKGPTLLLFALTTEGEPAPLGTVGQRKRLTQTMEMDLPKRISRPIQAFLLALLLTLIAQRSANAST
jgi:hypothetical protein